MLTTEQLRNRETVTVGDPVLLSQLLHPTGSEILGFIRPKRGGKIQGIFSFDFHTSTM